MKRGLSILWLAGLILSAACAAIRPVGAPSPATTVAAGDTLTPVKLGVGYIPNVQFAVFYVGIDKGIFAQEGIDLSLGAGRVGLGSFFNTARFRNFRLTQA